MANSAQVGNKDVLIIDYGVGNHLSIINTLSFLGYSFKVSVNKKDIIAAKAYILPGVGAFNEAMKNLNKLKIIDTLGQQVLENKKPILGICLGMQVMADSSQEKGLHAGLGWIRGNVVRIKSLNNVRVPHVGWNQANILKKDPLFSRVQGQPHFYFDHSYHFECERRFKAATCSYGEEITAAVQRENIFGVQFHPEKSQNNGLKLFRGFFSYIKEQDKNA
jgi:imidazole glycerol-phosphate synthase subunit HisH